MRAAHRGLGRCRRTLDQGRDQANLLVVWPVFPRLATIALALAAGGFVIGLVRAIWLVGVGAHRASPSIERPRARFRRLWNEGFLQRRLRNDRSAGLAHQCIFVGFILLVPRTAILFGRACIADFAGIGHRWAFCANCLTIYQWVKDFAAVAVVLATSIFLFRRLLPRKSRFTRSFVGVAIPIVIATMMLADLIYDGAGTLLAIRLAAASSLVGTQILSPTTADFIAPFAVVGSTGLIADVAATPMTMAVMALLEQLDNATIQNVGLASFSLHLLLVLAFLLVLPQTKHLHLIAVWPNLFFDSPYPVSRIAAVAADPEELLSKVEAYVDATADGDPLPAAVGIGIGSLGDCSRQERLNWLACTACGRCSEQCPATSSGKPLDPRALSCDLRRHLQATPLNAERRQAHLALPLVPTVLEAAALWACTNCGACEELCPAGVRFVAPIVDLRRHLFMLRGEAPPALQRPFAGMERQGNPWNLPQQERARWADGLGVELIGEVDSVEYLYWVGCAASYDDRAQSVARALVRIMQRARVRFAILGAEERCTGDMARRTGNELLFLELAKQNIEVLLRYRAQGRFSRIITACPHCLSTLSADYAALGANFEVVSHVEAIEQWRAEGRITVDAKGFERLTYHDPCHLARHARVVEPPRRLLDAIPNVQRVESEHHGFQTRCCGAGGGQMWLGEEPFTRMNQLRAAELVATAATQIVVACPFCHSMIEDGMRALDSGASAEVRDIAELVDAHCQGKIAHAEVKAQRQGA